MALHNPPPIETPLVVAEDGEEVSDTQLTKSIIRLEAFLRIFGFCQYSVLSFGLSWLCFLLLGVALPLLIIIRISYCSNCEKFQIRSFELEILISQAIVAAVSLLCISHNLRKYGARKFLFVDRYHGHMTQFRQEYIHKINGFFRLLGVWVSLCFLLKAAREVLHLIYAHHSWWGSVGILVALLVSWTYSTVIFLTGTALFYLVCNLQVIHFENYGKLLERDLDVSVYIEEHIRLNHHLSKISHRFRIFLIFEFLFVTASQFVSLLETTGNRGIINFANGGDFAVCSIVELVGIIICLHAAAKISRRAQGVGSVASRWHALVTCSNPNEASSQLGMNNGGGGSSEAAAGSLPISYSGGGSSEAAAYPAAGSLPISYSESDMESIDYVPKPTNTQLASYMSMYQKRQAFVTYLQSNPGGATVFGWTIDRALISTIFFVELSLVLFVLGKTITFTTK